MNGDTLPEDFWTRLEEKFDKVHGKMDMIYGKVTNIDSNGCAQRSNDIRRLDILDEWREKSTGKFIALLLAVIGSLSMAVYTFITHHK